jgi:hypothetical protein
MSEIDNFLVNPEDKEDDKQYIQPNIESKLSVEKRQACREIVREINQFGVSQRQLTYLIYLLSLNLENNDLMRKITNAIGEERENVKIEITETRGTTGLILDTTTER